jgi:hypothetical protein
MSAVRQMNEISDFQFGKPQTPTMTTLISDPGSVSASARGIAERFRAVYESNPRRIFRAPGRVNLIGEHTDYNDGFVMPAAIEFYSHPAVGKRADRTLSGKRERCGDRSRRWSGGGALTQVLTKGGTIKVPAETVLTFQLDKPVKIVRRSDVCVRTQPIVPEPA